TMNPHRDRIGILLFLPDDEHGVDAGFFGAEDAPLELVVAEFQFRADHLAAQFIDDTLSIIKLLLSDWQHAHLFGRKPEREISGVMFDEEPDESFMRAERSTVDAERRLLRVVFIAID